MIFIDCENAGYGDLIQLTQLVPLIESDYVYFRVRPTLVSLIRNSLKGYHPRVTVDCEPIQMGGNDTFQWYRFFNELKPGNPRGERFLWPYDEKTKDEPLDQDYWHVGIGWANHVRELKFSNHSTSPEIIAQPLQHPKFKLYGLMPDRTHEFTGPAFQDFNQSAQFIRKLDVVVTVDSCLAHLAAGLGVSTFVITPEHHATRYFDAYEARSPWYSSMRIYRSLGKSSWSERDPNKLADAAQRVADYLHTTFHALSN